MTRGAKCTMAGSLPADYAQFGVVSGRLVCAWILKMGFLVA